jgi:mannose-6-phosphate isomerase-like protein (cupin superfamily)
LSETASAKGVRVTPVEDLPLSDFARELVGEDHGARICLLFVDAEPGRGPSLHRHPYEEIFVMHEGQATFFLGDEQLEVRAGEVVVVPAGQPHAFVNSGDGRLRQLDIHVSPRFETEWLAQG